MPIACSVEHETCHEIDRAGRPYTFDLTHFYAIDTGKRIRTKSHLIQAQTLQRVASTESSRVGANDKDDRVINSNVFVDDSDHLCIRMAFGTFHGREIEMIGARNGTVQYFNVLWSEMNERYTPVPVSEKAAAHSLLHEAEHIQISMDAQRALLMILNASPWEIKRAQARTKIVNLIRNWWAKWAGRFK